MTLHLLVIFGVVGVARQWPVLHDCPVMDAVRLRALWPVPAFAPIYVTCVFGDTVQLAFAVLGKRTDVRPLCDQRRPGLNQPDTSFQIGTGPRTRPDSARARR